MDLKVQLDFLKQKTAELQNVIIDTQASADALTAAAYSEGYSIGFGAAQSGGSPTPPEIDPKIYTQSAMDATVAAIRSSLDAEIAALKANQSKIVTDQVRDQVEAFKAQLLAALEAEMAEERKLEAGVLALLQPAAPVEPSPEPSPEVPAPDPVPPAEPELPSEPAPVEPETPAEQPAEPVPAPELPSEPAPEAPAPEPSAPSEPSPEPEVPSEPAPAEPAPAEPVPAEEPAPSPEQPSDPLSG